MQKKTYESPEMEVVSTMLDVICQSGQIDNYNQEDYNWEEN